MCRKCGNNNCCCQKVTSSRGLKGERGLQGPKGDQGDPGANGAPGTAQTEINLRAANAGFSSLITLANSPLNDAELTLTAAVDGKYIVSYSGSVSISSNEDLTAGINIIVRKNGAASQSHLYSFNNAAVAYEVNQEEWKSVTIFDTIDLVATDVVDVQYERVNNPAPNINSTMVARGVLNLIKIA